MNCNEILNYMDKYCENRLDNFTKELINEHLEICEECKLQYIEMKELFNMLSEHSLLSPPQEFTANVMNKVNKVNKTKSISIRRMGLSLVAAGILLAMINISTPKANYNSVFGYIYKESIELNRIIVNPFNKLSINLQKYNNKLYNKGFKGGL